MSTTPEEPEADEAATTTPATATPATRTGHPGWARALIALASVLAVLAATTTWVKRQALDTDNWVAASDELLEDPDVQDALSQFLVDQLYANVDVQGELADLLPEDFQGLAGPASAALREPAAAAVQRLLNTTQVQALWSNANREAHSLLVSILEDDRAVVSTGGGVVTLQLGDLVRQLGEQLGLPSDVLDRIPDDAGNIVIARSDQLGAAQQAVALTQALSVWLFVLVVALYALAVFLAGDRRKAIRNVGWALLASAIVLLLIRRFSVGYALSMVANPANEPPARAVLGIFSELLAQIAWSGIAYALVLVAGALYAGPSRAATALRRNLAPAFSADPWAVWVGALAVFGLLVLWSPTGAFEAWWSTLLLLVIYVAGIEALRRQSRHEFPDARWDDLTGSVRDSARSAWSSVSGWRGRGAGATAAEGGVADLERLAALHASGELSDDEYAEAKRGVLARRS